MSARSTRSHGVPCATATASFAPRNPGNAVSALCAPVTTKSTSPFRSADMAWGAGAISSTRPSMPSPRKKPSSWAARAGKYELVTRSGTAMRVIMRSAPPGFSLRTPTITAWSAHMLNSWISGAENGCTSPRGSISSGMSAFDSMVHRHGHFMSPRSAIHFWIIPATWSEFLSIISMWPLPETPSFGRSHQSATPPSARSASA